MVFRNLYHGFHQMCPRNMCFPLQPLGYHRNNGYIACYESHQCPSGMQSRAEKGNHCYQTAGLDDT